MLRHFTDSLFLLLSEQIKHRMRCQILNQRVKIDKLAAACRDNRHSTGPHQVADMMLAELCAWVELAQLIGCLLGTSNTR